MFNYFLRDVHARRSEAVAKLQRVIDLIDSQSIFKFEQVKREQELFISANRSGAYAITSRN
jgi:hypothetical protein